LNRLQSQIERRCLFACPVFSGGDRSEAGRDSAHSSTSRVSHATRLSDSKRGFGKRPSRTSFCIVASESEMTSATLDKSRKSGFIGCWRSIRISWLLQATASSMHTAIFNLHIPSAFARPPFGISAWPRPLLGSLRVSPYLAITCQVYKFPLDEFRAHNYASCIAETTATGPGNLEKRRRTNRPKAVFFRP
jgi:hypothetical protein